MLWAPGPFEFRECPARFADPEEEAVVALHDEGFAKALTATERVHLPAALAEALDFLGRMAATGEVDS